ncbi:MAG: hypothetical protein CMJ76_09925 [Planctomycetaceae bacterium]|nr:hypothetical protein [Planctomycetaceae bacterium]|tara:strand:- start:275 stop:703 length:429 start_codon:yes stop_codon:yes gene_type:complete
MNELSNEDPTTWPEQLELLEQYSHKLYSLAREMVALLQEHQESKWEEIYASFAQAIGNAKTNRQRLMAINAIHSIYGGMGSWNDFYLLALGEAEDLRMSLSNAIYNLAETMKIQILSGPKEPKRSIWQKTKSVFFRSLLKGN